MEVGVTELVLAILNLAQLYLLRQIRRLSREVRAEVENGGPPPG